MPVRTGFIHGTSNALNVEIGFVPDYVRLTDITNGDIITEGYFKRIVVFTSLSVAINVGNYIKGINSGATARINQVIIDTGSVAGGDAAGWLICDPFEVVGTLETENAQVYSSKPGPNAAVTDELGIAGRRSRRNLRLGRASLASARRIFRRRPAVLPANRCSDRSRSKA